jgi:uncharacterized membrane protein
MKITTRQIVVTAAMVAIVILLSAPPLRLGYIPFLLGVAITIVHIPVIIGAVMEGPLVGLIVGLLFGLSSLMWSYLAPTGPVDLYFHNPLVSVVPRLFIGPVAYLVYRLARANKPWKTALVLGVILLLAIAAIVVSYTTTVLGGDAGLQLLVLVASLVLGGLAVLGLVLALVRSGEVGAIGAAAVGGTLTNTLLVLTALGLLGDPPLPAAVLVAAGLTNGIPEIVAAVLITVAVVAAWKQIEVGRKGARILND